MAVRGLIMTGMVVAAGTRAAGEQITPHKLGSLRTVEQAAVSPDGVHVAYTLSVPRTPMQDDDGASWSELHVVRFDGGPPRPFVTGEVNVSSVKWTRDGKRITFLAKRGKDEFIALYAIAVDGGEARRVSSLKSDVASYSLSPDGKRAAVIAAEPEKEARKKAKEKGFKQEVYEEDWRQKCVYVVDLDNRDGEPFALALDGSAWQVQWSPIDDRLAVALSPTSLVDDSYMRQRVRVIDAKTGTVLARLDNPGKLGEVSWSPDGRRLAMIAGADMHDPSAARLLVAPATGPDLARLLPDIEADFASIAWIDADTIVAVLAKGVWTTVAAIGCEDRAVREIVTHGGPILGGLTVALDGSKMACVGNSPSHPGEVFTLRLGEQPRRLTESNAWLGSARFARQEPVQYKARDGLELEGVLVRPLDQEDHAPLILAVHGGPEAHVSNGWVTSYSNPGQVAAAHGFAVFYPNYRGSTGRGLAFAKSSQGDPGGKEFDDLVDAVDALIARGVVDKDHVGVTGGSYGGYATAWCATRFTDRFAAGVMMVGISNKLSKFGTTDIPEEEYYVHARKRPWDDWMFFLERSPVFHASQCRTPLLIMHGKDDPRVNVTQSREMYRRLKVGTQVPVRLVLYPGEEHGNRKAAAKLDYQLRMLQWMEHYLKGAGGAPPPYEIDYADPAANNAAPAAGT